MDTSSGSRLWVRARHAIPFALSAYFIGRKSAMSSALCSAVTTAKSSAPAGRKSTSAGVTACWKKVP
ncbi:MAG TPA: hypothetical protein VMZ71_04920 [Gemmataceae bacterium]|nr:hypothetical protein [Gemmataceae bacterium]